MRLPCKRCLVQSGTRAAEVETGVVDFNEEHGTGGPGGRRTPIGSEHEPAAVKLAAEVACLANSEDGGILLEGVHEKASGPAAFVGTQLDLEWLRRRIQTHHYPQVKLNFSGRYVLRGGKYTDLAVPSGDHRGHAGRAAGR